MTTGLKISGFLLALTAVFGAGFGAGSLLDPLQEEPPPSRGEPREEPQRGPHGDGDRAPGDHPE